ncbi:glycosyltransferase [Flavivirga sp. 57AJ16]|uniref:glycosyltransferase n=1 Tax=Flavivirga sp. 57AJ16 TaxID=3025307 RepID=UPI002366BDFA|nr:glycosyltransferase [Flavivirga sp. 57AJ16]MDD7885920.1 glycosyltransferase [Flavivirga sp. 57AJ16]
MRTKIVHITTVHYRYDVRIHYKYCKTLSKENDLNVTLVVADGDGPEQIEGLTILDLGKIKFGRLGRFIIGNFKVLKFGLSNKMDLMHFHDPELLPSIAFLRLIEKKIVFDMHENFPLQILTKTYISKFIRIILSKGVQLFQNLFFRFIPVIFAEFSYEKHFPTIKEKETILNYPLKTEVTGIQAEKFNKFTIGYMGSVTVERGALIMLETVAKLRKQGEEVNIFFVGPLDNNIKEHAICLEAINDGWAIFKGRLKPKEGWQFMAQCHIGMAVLKDSPNFIESYPTKLFEYMLLKLPIITSNFPLYTDIINDAKCGIVVSPSSVEDISDAILKIKTNNTERMLMGERGYKRAIEKYSWESSELSKLKHFYSKVLK